MSMYYLIAPSDWTAIIRDSTAIMYKGCRHTWSQYERKSQKITNLKKASLLPRPVRSYRALRG